MSRTPTHCNALQHTATQCNTLQDDENVVPCRRTNESCHELQHTATHSHIQVQPPPLNLVPCRRIILHMFCIYIQYIFYNRRPDPERTSHVTNCNTLQHTHTCWPTSLRIVHRVVAQKRPTTQFLNYRVLLRKKQHLQRCCPTLLRIWRLDIIFPQ